MDFKKLNFDRYRSNSKKRKHKMTSINTASETNTGLYAMKKAMDVQAQGIMKVLESAQPSPASSNNTSGSSITGVGQNLDLRA
jgi:hypothetical protein